MLAVAFSFGLSVEKTKVSGARSLPHTFPVLLLQQLTELRLLTQFLDSRDVSCSDRVCSLGLLFIITFSVFITLLDEALTVLLFEASSFPFSFF